MRMRANGMVLPGLLIRHDRARPTAAGWTAAVLLATAVLLSGTPLWAQTPPPGAQEVPLDWALIPSEMGPGDTFRLLFVTSTQTPLTSDSIGDYNAFVQGRAATGHAAIQAYSSHFRVLASTATVAARDNTGTNPHTDGVGEPIYWLGSDEKVANDYEDLYDEAWNSESWTTEAGGSGSDAVLRVLNGSTWDGRSKPKWPFRNITTTGERVGGGSLNGGGSNPMYSSDGYAGADGRLSATVYGLSSVFRVAPDTSGAGGLYVGDAMVVEGQTASFVVTMDGALPETATVDYATSDATATAGSDYTAVSGALTFAPGETSKTVSVTTLDDTAEEDVEEFRLTLSNASANARVSDATGIARIEGSELTAEFLNVPASHDGSGFTFMLLFSEDPGPTFSPQILTGDGTQAGRMAVTNGRLGRISPYFPGDTLRWRIKIIPDRNAGDVTISLRPTTDCAAENAICTADGRSLLAAVEATVRGPPPGLSVGDASAAEGADATVDFAVTLRRLATETVTVDYATTDGTAMAGRDYTSASGTLTFGAGETLKTVSVAVLDDDAEEDEETFTLTLSSASGGRAYLSDPTATGTIEDDDEAVALTAEFRGLPESHGGEAFTFQLGFSEEFELSYQVLLGVNGEPGAISVTGGSLTGLSRVDRAKDQNWNITVEPGGTADVTIALPATTDCEAANAICTDDDRPLSHSLSATVVNTPDTTPTPPVTTPLTAEFRGLPESHGGEAFTFQLGFSEEFELSYKVLLGVNGEPGAVSVTGGSLKGLSRVDRGKDQNWNITVEPGGTADVTVALPATTDCEAANAICTGDDRPLSHSLSATVVNTPDTIGTPPVTTPLTAEFRGLPESHGGEAFTFQLGFSEEFELSYKVLLGVNGEPGAISVTGGSLKGLSRVDRGKDQNWNITVEPGGTADVTVALPATSDCEAANAICTGDDRPLSSALSATVVETASAGDAAREDAAREDAMGLVDGVTPEEASEALFGEQRLSEAQKAALDRLGNRNGGYDLGDLLSWIERCRRGEARCGRAPADPGPASSAALMGVAAAGRRPTSRPRGRRGPGRRRARMAGYRLAVLLAAASAWSCTGDPAGPPLAEPDPGSPVAEWPQPATAIQDPGFLTVEWTVPATSRDIGVLLELEGPGIEDVLAPGLELFHSAANGRHQIVVAGSLEAGPLMQFRVPDRGQLPLYRARVLQVTGEDYGLKDAGEYQTVITPN